jgi:hypothetical protein
LHWSPPTAAPQLPATSAPRSAAPHTPPPPPPPATTSAAATLYSPTPTLLRAPLTASTKPPNTSAAAAHTRASKPSSRVPTTTSTATAASASRPALSALSAPSPSSAASLSLSPNARGITSPNWFGHYSSEIEAALHARRSGPLMIGCMCVCDSLFTPFLFVCMQTSRRCSSTCALRPAAAPAAHSTSHHRLCSGGCRVRRLRL